MTETTDLEAALERASSVSTLIQGEVLAVPDACVVVAEASSPLSALAAEAAARDSVDSGLIFVGHIVDEVVLLTQTCDLQNTTADEFHCLVAPLMRVDPRLANEASRGRRPRLAGLPWVDESSVADLSRITTVERSVLLGAESRGRPRSPRERLHFAQTISRYLTRPALPDAINEVLAPFVKRIAEKHDKESAEGRCAHLVAELRLEATPDIDAAELALNVLMVLDEENLPSLPKDAVVDDERIDALVAAGRDRVAQAVQAATDPVARREAWTAMAECWIQPSVDKVDEVPGVQSVGIAVINGEELSYARSLEAPVLDVRYLSTRAA